MPISRLVLCAGLAWHAAAVSLVRQQPDDADEDENPWYGDPDHRLDLAAQLMPMPADEFRIRDAHAKYQKHGRQHGYKAGVTFMINCIERDANAIEAKVAHLVKQQNYEFYERVLVLDTQGGPLSDDFRAVAKTTIKNGDIDRYLVVDYDLGYVSAVRDDIGWNTNYVRLERGAGNLVYVFMIDQAKTKYLVHFDLDVIMYSAPGYSWVADAVKAAEADPGSAFFVVNPLVESHGTTTTAKTCADRNQAVWMQDMTYLMDVETYEHIWDLIHSNSTFYSKWKGVKSDRHHEEIVSMTVCGMRQAGATFHRVDLLESDKSWVLHHPQANYCNSDLLNLILRLTEQGKYAIRGNRPWNADDPQSYLRMAYPPGVRVPPEYATGPRANCPYPKRG